MSRTSYLRRPLAALLMAAALAASVLMAVVVLASPAWAATYTVTSKADSGAGSLRQAIIDANATTGVADTINFKLGSSATITLTSGQLPTITDGAGLTIDGGSADITISGANQHRVFLVDSGKLTLRNLTVANGASGSGGGILSVGTLEVSNSTLSGNTSDYVGGGIYNCGTLEVSNSILSGNSANGATLSIHGGGIYNGCGTATVSNSTLSGNSAFYGGGGISNDGGGTLEVINSNLFGNRATYGFGGGIFNQGGTLEVSGSTLSGNSATRAGGGIVNNSAGTATVSNSTLSSNSAALYGGGIENDSGSTLEVSNTTLSGNSAPNGGGISNFDGPVALKNTIVANSPSGESCFGTITNGGYNLDSGTSCGFPTQNSSKDPLLGPLADNGGPTLTHALLEGSPAIDQGNSFGESTDQRGLPRPSDFASIPDASGGDGSDIGAFEVQLPATDTTPPKVVSTIPKVNSTEPAPTANLRATFSEEMDSNTINAQTFKLFKKGTTTQIAAQVTYSASTRTARLDPTNNLSRGVTYKAVVTTGAKDLADNRLDQNTRTTGSQQKVWYFTVDD